MCECDFERPANARLRHCSGGDPGPDNGGGFADPPSPNLTFGAMLVSTGLLCGFILIP